MSPSITTCAGSARPPAKFSSSRMKACLASMSSGRVLTPEVPVWMLKYGRASWIMNPAAPEKALDISDGGSVEVGQTEVWISSARAAG
jgi:hypothetical protein